MTKVKEGCASCFWHFLGIFIYIFDLRYFCFDFVYFFFQILILVYTVLPNIILQSFTAWQGWTQRGFQGFSGTPFWLKISFSLEILDKFGIPKYSHFFSLHLILPFNKTILLPIIVCKIVGWVANSVDPDQMPHSVESNLVLHCLLRVVCLIVKNKYGNWSNWTCSKIILDALLHSVTQVVKLPKFEWNFVLWITYWTNN